MELSHMTTSGLRGGWKVVPLFCTAMFLVKIRAAVTMDKGEVDYGERVTISAVENLSEIIFQAIHEGRVQVGRLDNWGISNRGRGAST